jgi:SpoIID/LytB domain protein
MKRDTLPHPMRVWPATFALVLGLALPGSAAAGTVFLLDGRGWGHGVGMSQWGAEGYARHGYDYQQILAHYYPHTTLQVVAPRPVRVLLLQGQHKIRIGSAAPFLVVDAIGRKIHLPRGAVVVDRSFAIRHPHLRQPLRFEPGAAPLEVDRAGYRGDVVVHDVGGTLMAVNVVPLDRYLRGVVPEEAPAGWHDATYKAQAVAARSYALATIHPNAYFDLYSDSRSQVYGGIKAERPETNLAIGATAGKVLTYDGAVIEAFYFSSSGGWTSSVHDAWPKMQQVPYLVSVRDPYDYIAPHDRWPTKILTPEELGDALGLRDVRDARVVLNSSHRAAAVRVLAANGWTVIPAAELIARFKLASSDFDLSAFSLEPVAGHVVPGEHVRLRGWIRGLGRARLQELTNHGWVTTAHLRPSSRGWFAVSFRAVRTTELRLAYNGLAGGAVELRVERPARDVAKSPRR